MPPKRSTVHTRTNGHSRTTSATKLPPTINLQFTQKKGFPQMPRQLPQTKAAPPPPAAPPQQKHRAGFHIASPSNDGDEDDDEIDADDDEGAWVSSESGAVTPNPHDDDDDDGASSDGPPDVITLQVQAAAQKQQKQKPELPRVATARPSDFNNEVESKARGQTPTATKQSQTHTPTQTTPDKRLPEPPLEPRQAAAAESQTAPSSPLYRRHPRPQSTHSVTRPELRPHPLIRGQSFGLVGPQACLQPKPSPLLPVAVTLDAATAAAADVLSSSPTDVSASSPLLSSTSSAAPSLARRPSVSSTRSAATLATPTLSHLPDTHAPAHRYRSNGHVHPGQAQRDRTLSTLSTFSTFSNPSSSSSAALSSLTHLSGTGTHRPAPHVVYFPPPPAVPDTRIHPLLPPPYVAAHLSVLAHRQPIREAFERVGRAKREAARVGS